MAWRRTLVICVLALSCGTTADAGPWAEVGDAQTRSDVELAAAYGLVNNVTMQWPAPWTGILGSLQDERQTDELPPEVREAAARLLAKGREAVHVGRAHAEIAIDATNTPATVRGYDALGRGKAQAQAVYEYVSSDAAVRLAVGSQTLNRGDKQGLVFDDSYIAARIDGMIVYAGYLQRWWGPGWISAMSLSNNARPMPQIGFSRVQTDQSRSWLLSWLGPWQAEIMVGLMDGPRTDINTGYVAVRVDINPLPGLEIAGSRTTQICGRHHDCRPLVNYFTLSNDDQHVNSTNDQGSIELRYTNSVFSQPFALYAQLMNEDSSPLVHSVTSKLFGGSVWLPFRGLTGRLTLEYANSLPTEDLWGGRIFHGSAYNNTRYTDGMRYRKRTLGFSLDSDSVLYSAQASVIDPEQRTWTLTYHRALVSSSLNTFGNIITNTPVRFNALEARLSLPMRWGDYAARIDASGRWQSDQPRPEQGSALAVEVALRFGI